MDSRKRKDLPLSSNETGHLGGECSKKGKVWIIEENDKNIDAIDTEKLERERCYLTNNNKFIPELVKKYFKDNIIIFILLFILIF